MSYPEDSLERTRTDSMLKLERMSANSDLGNHTDPEVGEIEKAKSEEAEFNNVPLGESEGEGEGEGGSTSFIARAWRNYGTIFVHASIWLIFTAYLYSRVTTNSQ
jgi:hypothetical protein